MQITDPIRFINRLKLGTRQAIVAAKIIIESLMMISRIAGLTNVMFLYQSESFITQNTGIAHRGKLPSYPKINKI